MEGVEMVINSSTAYVNTSRWTRMESLSGARKSINISSDTLAGSKVSETLPNTPQADNPSSSNGQLQNALSYAQTQDSFLTTLNTKLQKAFDLSIKAQTPSLSQEERDAATAQIQATVGYINELASKDFNGVGLFNGAKSTSTTASTPDASQLTAIDMTQGAYAELGKAVDLQTPETAQKTTAALQDAMAQLTTDRSNELAKQIDLSNPLTQFAQDATAQAANRGEVALKTDKADSLTNSIKYQILVQSSIAMLSQANIMPAQTMRLLSL